jgi:hypothetical protein
MGHNYKVKIDAELWVNTRLTAILRHHIKAFL